MWASAYPGSCRSACRPSLRRTSPVECAARGLVPRRRSTVARGAWDRASGTRRDWCRSCGVLHGRLPQPLGVEGADLLPVDLEEWARPDPADIAGPRLNVGAPMVVD